ncbi:MAG TPA: hypothetical protein VL048_10625 [Xanthobacteraceae bacterium]|nr:hypothetical protein [Xanthobacteraceae bacterium]
MSETVTLSSRMTFFYKVVLPAVWISGLGTGTLLMWVSGGPPVAAKWWFLVVWCLGTAVTLWTCVPLKRLRTDGGNLYISNYLDKIVVPAGLIDRVTENRWINIHPVTIYFREDTEFGRKIVFMPKARFAFCWTSHPVVGEIETMARSAAAGGAS